MLKLSVFEFIVRTIPEVFVFMFAAYAFSNTKVSRDKYIISSISLGLSVFIIRLLPINYGVHTILNIIAMTVIAISINKIDIIKSIRASITTTILSFALEAVNIAVLSLVLGDKLESILMNIKIKTICGLPSLFILFMIVIIYYLYLNRKGKLANE